MFTSQNGLATLVGESKRLADAIKEGKLQTRANPEAVNPKFRPVVEVMNIMLDALVAPLNVTAEYVDRISKGDIPPKITDNYNGDFNEIKNNLNQCIDALNGLTGEMKHMSEEHNKGDIDVVDPCRQVPGRLPTMAKGVNEMVGGHIAVKKKAMACLAEFGKGNFEAPLEKFPGKKAFINDTIEQMRTNLKALIADANVLSKAAIEGKLQTRADASKHQGDFRKIVEGVNATLDSVIGPLNVAAEYVDRISKGDIPPKITDTYHGDFNEIKGNLNACIDVMNGLLQETNSLIKATQEGKLQTRGNAQRFAGGWGELVGGVNKLIDAFVAPINVTAEYVDRISKGDIPPKITDTYHGDFNEIKGNLYACIDVMNGLLQETNSLIKATQEGKLQTRGNAQAVRRRLGRIGGRREQADRRLCRADQRDCGVRGPDLQRGHPAEDHRHLQRRLQRDQGQPQRVHRRDERPAQETNTLIKATQEGKLQTRGNAEQFAGGWGELVGGVNKLIDAFVAPINVTAEYVDRISKGDIPPKITDTYNGDFNEIKGNLNACIDALSGLIAEMNRMSRRA